MKVWVIEYTDYDENWIFGLFESREVAESVLDETKAKCKEFEQARLEARKFPVNKSVFPGKARDAYNHRDSFPYWAKSKSNNFDIIEYEIFFSSNSFWESMKYD